MGVVRSIVGMGMGRIMLMIIRAVLAVGRERRRDWGRTGGRRRMFPTPVRRLPAVPT